MRNDNMQEVPAPQQELSYDNVNLVLRDLVKIGLMILIFAREYRAASSSPPDSQFLILRG